MTDLVIDFDKNFEKQALYAVLKGLKGKQIIKIAKHSNKRSLKVNAYYRVVLNYISEETGHSDSYLHEVFKEEYIPKVKFRQEFHLTTTDMTNEEMWEYITEIRQWAKDFLHIDCPDPDGVIL